MGKISELIYKETRWKNETKRMTVTIRQLCLIFVALTFFNLLISVFLLKSWAATGFWVAMFALDFLTFAISYITKRKVLTAIFLLQKTVGVIVATYLFGWEAGFQFYLVLLVVIYSFVEAGYNIKKLIYTFFNFSMFTFFLIFAKGDAGKINIESVDRIIQILNALAFSVTVGLVSFTFSRDSQYLEDKLVSYNDQLKQQASVDALTGLYNRRRTMEFMEELVKKEESISLCICDIDFFKKVNDSYGHDFGDTVLVAISEILRKYTKDYGYVSRWGGEEFLIIFPNMNGDEAYVKLYDIRKAIKDMKLNYNQDEVRVTMTYGLTEYDLTVSFEENVKEADEKLYLGKQSGRDKIVY